MNFIFSLLFMIGLAFGQDFDNIQIDELPMGEVPSTEEAENRTKKLATLIRCTVCQGLSIEESTSTWAVKTRNRIHQLILSGYTDEQIINYFVDKYGEKALLKPLWKHWFVWLAPVGFVLIGLGVVIYRTQGKSPKEQEESAEQVEPTSENDSYRQQILSELEE